jgi:disulfide bond formation protein DsbB
MSTAAVELFYGLLAVAAMLGIAATVGLRVLSPVSVSARTVLDGLRDTVRPHGLRLAWAVALLATVGSLYFSEIAGFTPCTLCWYQRIAMYPLVVVLGIGAIRGDRGASTHATALAAVGALIAGYHVALEWIPALDSGACDPTSPCTFVWFRTFGFISLPLLALTAFLLILTVLALASGRSRSPR